MKLHITTTSDGELAVDETGAVHRRSTSGAWTRWANITFCPTCHEATAFDVIDDHCPWCRPSTALGRPWRRRRLVAA